MKSRYARTSSTTATATVRETVDGTVLLLIEDEHGVFGLSLTPQESAELRATLAAAEARIEDTQ